MVFLRRRGQPLLAIDENACTNLDLATIDQAGSCNSYEVFVGDKVGPP